MSSDSQYPGSLTFHVTPQDVLEAIKQRDDPEGSYTAYASCPASRALRRGIVEVDGPYHAAFSNLGSPIIELMRHRILISDASSCLGACYDVPDDLKDFTITFDYARLRSNFTGATFTVTRSY